MKIAKISIAIICLVQAGFSTAMALEMKLPIIAVTAFEGRKVDSIDARTISDALSDNLLQTKKVRVIERSQINQILQEQGFQNSGACDNQSCAVEIGKLLGANRIIIGSISKLGRTYAMFAKLVDVQSGEVIRSSQKNIEGRLETILTDIVPIIAKELVGINQQKFEAHSRKNAELEIDRVSLEAEDAISDVNGIGIVIADNNENDSLVFAPKFYVVNNSKFPISNMKFSINIPRDFSDIATEVIYAPNCESLMSSAKNQYNYEVACSFPEIDIGGVWPQRKDGIQYRIKSNSNSSWKRRNLINISKSWKYHPEIEVKTK